MLIILVSFAVIVYGGVFLWHKVIFPIHTSIVPTIQAVSDGVIKPLPKKEALEFGTYDYKLYKAR